MENDIKEPAPKYNYISPEDYLEMDRNADFKHEYYWGQVLAMSGASLKHNVIVGNLIETIGNFLKNKNCRILPSAMRICTPSQDSYMYPDATIVCGEPQLEDDKFDTLKNPSVIFEILFPSTRSIDKGRKFFFYRQIPSLQEYIMIDSTRKIIQVARKLAEDSWKFEDIASNSAFLLIQTISYKVQLTKIYNGTGL